MMIFDFLTKSYEIVGKKNNKKKLKKIVYQVKIGVNLVKSSNLIIINLLKKVFKKKPLPNINKECNTILKIGKLFRALIIMKCPIMGTSEILKQDEF